MYSLAGSNPFPGIDDNVFQGESKRAKRGPGRPRGSRASRAGRAGRPVRRARGRAGPGRPPLRGADVLRRGRATFGKSVNTNFLCHICALTIESDEEEINCDCFTMVHEDCYQNDGCNE